MDFTGYGRPLRLFRISTSKQYCSTVSQHDFDFLFGQHVHNRRLRNPLAGSNEWYEFDRPRAKVRCLAAWEISNNGWARALTADPRNRLTPL